MAWASAWFDYYLSARWFERGAEVKCHRFEWRPPPRRRLIDMLSPQNNKIIILCAHTSEVIIRWHRWRRRWRQRESCDCFAWQNEREKKNKRIGFHTNDDFTKEQRKNQTGSTPIQMHFQRQLASTCAWRHSTKRNAIADPPNEFSFIYTHFCFHLTSIRVQRTCIALVTLHCVGDAYDVTAPPPPRVPALSDIGHQLISINVQHPIMHLIIVNLLHESHWIRRRLRYIFIAGWWPKFPYLTIKSSFFPHHNLSLISLSRRGIHLVLAHRWTALWTIEWQRNSPNMLILITTKSIN